MPKDGLTGLGLRQEFGPNKIQEEAEKELRRKLSTLRDKLKEVIFGQDKAIDVLSDAIMISQAGLRKKDRLVGSFLFLGPTGSGKTEVAIQLANIMDYKFLRIDMSEFKHSHQVSRLIGSPPGYVGFKETPGQLTSFVTKNPKCVVLLDEIEKAHPDVFDMLLQIMDYAKLTDGANKTTDFSNVILIMTSNLGAAEKHKPMIGLGDSGDNDNVKRGTVSTDRANIDARSDEMMRKVFSPEFRNRLDEVIEFGELPPDVIAKVVDKFLRELEDQLKKKSIVMTITPEARQYVAANGFDRLMGARPLDRFITREIRKKIAPEVVYGKLEKGGSVEVGVAKDEKGKEKLSFVFNSKVVPGEQKPDTPAPTAPQEPVKLNPARIPRPEDNWL